MLTMAHQRNPTGRWWIKADGCDILKGLRESTKREWNGDVDMNDGVPQQHHHKYLSRLTKAATLKCSIPPPDTFYNKITTQKNDFKQDLAFPESDNDIKPCLHKIYYIATYITGLKHTEERYTAKMGSGRSKQRRLSELAWEVHEYKTLIAVCKDLIARLDSLDKFLKENPSKAQCIEVNLAHQLTTLGQLMPDFIKSIETKQREPATHVLFFLISDERRAKKPYAVPVQYVAYSSLKDNDI
jgi:hypothetical protein